MKLLSKYTLEELKAFKKVRCLNSGYIGVVIEARKGAVDGPWEIEIKWPPFSPYNATGNGTSYLHSQGSSCMRMEPIVEIEGFEL